MKTIIIVATARGLGYGHTSITHLIDTANQAWPVLDAYNAHVADLARFYTPNGLLGNTPVLPYFDRVTGAKWMQTVANGVPTDNLLNLPIRRVAA